MPKQTSKKKDEPAGVFGSGKGRSGGGKGKSKGKKKGGKRSKK